MTPRRLPNRRTRQEKRAQDFGPPSGYAERRKLPERRYLEVGFLEFDEHIELKPLDDASYSGVSESANHTPDQQG